MNSSMVLLIIEALSFYALVLLAHSLRMRYGPGVFYALLGGITVVMSWVTETGIRVEAFGLTFLTGSAVFYTALILGVFVVYVIDGLRSSRIAIFTIAIISILTPVIMVILPLQLNPDGQAVSNLFPVPNLRVNAASVVTTLLDLVFLAMAWEFLGDIKLRVKIWMRTFLTLLGVMFFDTLLFNTMAFAGSAGYLDILQGALISRILISVLAFPVLYGYLRWQASRKGVLIEQRPVLAILKDATDGTTDLAIARREIQRRRQTEETLHRTERQYETLFEKVLTGFGLHEVIYDYRGAPKDYRFLAVNPAFENMTGLQAKDVVGKSVLQFIPQMGSQWIEAYEQVVLTGKSVYFEHHAIETNTYLAVTAFMTEKNQFACILNDITDRKEAEDARKEIKILSGLLPICAACKQIRNDDGYWESVESYISSHSEADFTHSLCPDCIKKYYPEYSEDL